MEDTRNKPPDVGMFRIFQQSLKGMGSIMEHKKHFKGQKALDTAESSEVSKNTAENSFDGNKADSKKDNSSSLAVSIIQTETTAKKLEENSMQGSTSGFPGKKKFLWPRRSYRRPQSQNKAPAGFNQTPYNRWKSPAKKTCSSNNLVTELSSVKQTAKMDNWKNSSAEDWSQELIDVKIDDNQNVIDVSSSVPKLTQAVSSQKVDENLNPTNDQDTFTNQINDQSDDTNLTENKDFKKQDEVNGICYSLKEDSFKFDTDNMNNNSVKAQSLYIKPSENDKQTASEDWSLELDEVNVDLFILQKNRNTSTSPRHTEDIKQPVMEFCDENDNASSLKMLQAATAVQVAKTNYKERNFYPEMTDKGVLIQPQVNTIGTPEDLKTQSEKDKLIINPIAEAESTDFSRKHFQENPVYTPVVISVVSESLNLGSEGNVHDVVVDLKSKQTEINDNEIKFSQDKATEETVNYRVKSSAGTENISSAETENITKSDVHFRRESRQAVPEGITKDSNDSKLGEMKQGAGVKMCTNQNAGNKTEISQKLYGQDETVIKDKSKHLTDLEIRTNIVKEGFIENTQRIVTNKGDEKNMNKNQTCENKQKNNDFNQDHMKEEKTHDSAFSKRRHNFRKFQNYSGNFYGNSSDYYSPYTCDYYSPYIQDNAIPPRFRKQPAGVYRANGKNVYENRAYPVPLYPDDRYFYRPYIQDQYQYYPRRNDLNIGRLRRNDNKSSNSMNNEQPSVYKCKPAFSENFKKAVNFKREEKHTSLKSPETAIHVPENWNEEIDKSFEVIGTNDSKYIESPADTINEKCESREISVSKNTDENSSSQLMKPFVPLSIVKASKSETLSINVNAVNQKAESHLQTENVSYLPPSPDELEQASFMAYMTQSRNEMVRSGGAKENDSGEILNEKSNDRIVDDKIVLLDKDKSMVIDTLDLPVLSDLSNQGLDAGKETNHWSTEKETCVHIKAETEFPKNDEKLTVESINDSDSRDTFEKVDIGKSKAGSRQDARIIVGSENCEVSSNRLDTTSDDQELCNSHEFEGEQGPNEILIEKDIIVRKSDAVFFETEAYECSEGGEGSGDIAKFSINNENVDAVEINNSTEDDVIREVNFKDSEAVKRCENVDKDDENKTGFSPSGAWQTNPMQFYANNQLYSSPWQYYHPSYFYSEQYRSWYEQVYVPHRYMQICGYYDTPFNEYNQEYLADYYQPTVANKVKQNDEASADQKVQKPKSPPECRQTLNKSKENRSLVIHTSGHEKNATDVDIKMKSVENKLSDYWEDRMPDWVDKQCKVAKMKNETLSENVMSVNANKESDYKTKGGDEHLAHKCEKETNIKRETVNAVITGDVIQNAINKSIPDHKPRNSWKESVEDKNVIVISSEELKSSKFKSERPREKLSELKVKITGNEAREEDTKAREVDKEENYAKKVQTGGHMTTSDLTIIDSDSLIQPKPGCTCSPDNFHYLVWKTCECSAGLIPAPEDIVPVYPDDRYVDQGYQSFDSLVAEDGIPSVRTPNKPLSHQPRPLFFSTVPLVRHSTPEPHGQSSELDTKDKSNLDQSRAEQDRSGFEPNSIQKADKTGSSDKPANIFGKIGTPPGFRTGMHKPKHQSRPEQQLQYMQSSGINMESFLSHNTSEKGGSVDINENLISDSGSSEQRQRRRSGDQLRQQVDSKLKELIEMAKAKTEALKAAKKKSSAQKENIESRHVQAKADNAGLGDNRILHLTKDKPYLQASETESNVSEGNGEGHPLRQQIEKMRRRSKLEEKVKPMTVAHGDKYRYNWEVSPPQSAVSLHTAAGMLDNSNYVNGNKVKDSDETKASDKQKQKTETNEVMNLAVKSENEKGTDRGEEVECNVKHQIPRGRSRSCTVSVSESMTDIEAKNNSSDDNRLLDEVKSQSTEEKRSSDIKEHDICELNITVQGLYSKKMEGIPFNKEVDTNNNCMAEVAPRHPGFGYPGIRMPYRLQHNAFDYRTRLPQTGMRSPTNFSERTALDHGWGSEGPSRFPYHPWMSAPVFRPRNFEETPLFPGPWYMPPPPPPFPPPGAMNEGQRKIYRPVYEQICTAQDDKSSSKSPPAPFISTTGVTPEFERKNTFAEKSVSSAKKCLDKNLKKSRLVDYNYSDGDISSDEEIEAFDESSLDSGDIENLRPEQKSVAQLLTKTAETNHAAKRFKVSSPVENIDFSEKAFPDLATAAKIEMPQKSAGFARRPMKKLKQTTLKAFPSEVTATDQARPHETLKKNMTLSEVVAASLKKETPNQEVDFAGLSATEQLYSAKCQQNLPPYPPPLPPFPASPFWSMYLTNSNSALQGKDPNEEIYSPGNFAIPGPRGILGTWTRPALSPATRKDPRFLFSPSETDSESQSKKSDGVKQFKRFHNFGVKYIDTHCHLDFLFNRTNFNGNLKDFMEENPDTFPEMFEGCVTIFCYPTSFSTTDRVLTRLMEEKNVWFAMGCHPKMATDYTEKAEWGLKQCLKHPKCVALGEIGLDYSGTFKQHEAVQKMVFKRQLEIAIKLNKPLVIHCRDAEEDCLEIMKENVPPKYKIHCHCFTGSYANAKLWMDAFPCLMIGLTPLVTYPSATPSHDLARHIPLEKLLLETDAPYFVPRCRPRLDMEFSNPGFAITVAKAVAQYQEIPVAMVLRQCRLNTKDFYGI